MQCPKACPSLFQGTDGKPLLGLHFGKGSSLFKFPQRSLFQAHLSALSVDNGWARFIIFSLGDPHLFEGGEGSKDGSSNPDRVLSLRRSDNLDGHGLRGKLVELILQSLVNLLEHGGSSRHDGVGVQILSDIDVALHDRLEGQGVDSLLFNSNEGRLEQNFWASESFVSNGNDVSVGKFVVLLEVAGGVGVSHFLFEVHGNEAKLFLDITDDFSFGGGGEGVSSFRKDLLKIFSQVSSCKIQSKDGMRQAITFIDWHSVRDTITGVKNNTGGSSGGVQGKDSLDGDVHGGGVEGLEHDLAHLFSVGLGVHWGFSQKNVVFFRSNSKLIVEGVMPDLLHVIPVGHNTVLDWVLQGKNSSLGLGFITNV